MSIAVPPCAHVHGFVLGDHATFLLLGGPPGLYRASVQHPHPTLPFRRDEMRFTHAELEGDLLDLTCVEHSCLGSPKVVPAALNPLRLPRSRDLVGTPRPTRAALRAEPTLDRHHVLARHESHDATPYAGVVTTGTLPQTHPDALAVTEVGPMGCTVVPSRQAVDVVMMQMTRECRDEVHQLLGVLHHRREYGQPTAETELAIRVALGGHLLGAHPASTLHLGMAPDGMVSDTLLMHIGDQATADRSGVQLPTRMMLLSPEHARAFRAHPSRYAGGLAVQLQDRSGPVPMRIVCHPHAAVPRTARSTSRCFRPLHAPGGKTTEVGDYTVPVHSDAGLRDWQLSSAQDYTAGVAGGRLYLQRDQTDKHLVVDTDGAAWREDLVLGEQRLASRYRDARSAAHVQLGLKTPEYRAVPGADKMPPSRQAHEAYASNRPRVWQLAAEVAAHLGRPDADPEHLQRALDGRPTDDAELVARVSAATPGERLVCRQTAATLREMQAMDTLLAERPESTMPRSARLCLSRTNAVQDGIGRVYAAHVVAAGHRGRCTSNRAVVVVHHQDARGHQDATVLMPDREHGIDGTRRSKSVHMDTAALRRASSVAVALGQEHNRSFAIGWVRPVHVAGAGPVETRSMGRIDTRQFARFEVGWRAQPHEDYTPTVFEVCTANELAVQAVPISRTVPVERDGVQYMTYNPNWRVRVV